MPCRRSGNQAADKCSNSDSDSESSDSSTSFTLSLSSQSNSSPNSTQSEAGQSATPSDDSLPKGLAFKEAYSLENMIGYGSYARVYRCVDRRTSENFAVKVIEEKLLSSYQRDLIRNEEDILRRLRHPNVIELVAVFTDELHVKQMVFEFADQLDVCLALVTDPGFGELSIKAIAKQLLCGLSYLHDEGIVHRDLKLENLLVKSDDTGPERRMVLKICDFGYAVKLAPDQTSFTLKNVVIGSYEYMSPELISSQEYSAKVDCWAAGVILYFLFTGEFPFKGKTITEMVRCIMKRKFSLDFAAPEWTAASLNSVGLIKSILEPYHYRPNAKELLKHAWFTGSPGDPKNATTDRPLPIMLQRERLQFLQHEAEQRLKQLYNSSSSNRSELLAAAAAAAATCWWSVGLVAVGRYRQRCRTGWREEATAREFRVNGALTDRKRSKSHGSLGTQ